ncbi:ectoine/hydroxyectoine ABC transporter permease subunit EhuD [Agromyces silvae]|uniref:ectoine/hydroxyectoine ABC transporter permease subunit EhuD n=1 Tax=Agromyces silvae TaxID=3388266 RepID=UPI00280AB954|nr:ectoine/hydroxyectoine ABC transporter permease subunit EhuD [Agromyces protaetiae]
MNDLWSWSTAWEALPQLLEAFVRVTLLVTVLGSAIAAVLGLLLAIARRSLPRPLSAILGFAMNFVRMTPIVVQLLFVYYLFLSVDPVVLGIVIFGVHYATYMAEAYRAGIDSIPAGQWEATTALSMSRRRAWTAVIIPQAVRATAPALGNYVISMLKDTPFLIAITVVELVRAALIIGGNTFRYVEVFTLAGIIFLLASYPTSLLVGRLEKRLAYTS